MVSIFTDMVFDKNR